MVEVPKLGRRVSFLNKCQQVLGFCLVVCVDRGLDMLAVGFANVQYLDSAVSSHSGSKLDEAVFPVAAS